MAYSCGVDHWHLRDTHWCGGRLIVRAIGLVRVKAKVGLRNLAYNLDRYCVLVGT
jgi:hypothetical protein